MEPEPKEKTTTMNVSLPASLRSFVDEQVAARGYTSASEFVRELIRGARERKTAEQRLEQMLLEGIESGPGEPFDGEFFNLLRDRIRNSSADHLDGSEENRAS